jgi:hypothetical protein
MIEMIRITDSIPMSLYGRFGGSVEESTADYPLS